MAPKLGINYIRYHSRLPLLSTVTGDATAVAATTEFAVAQQAAGLVGPYLSQGLEMDAARAAARTTAEALTLSHYTNAAGYRAEYPENLQAVGATFSIVSLRTGTLLTAEITRHMRVPYQLSLGTLLEAARSPVAFDPDIGTTPLGEFGADAVITGYRRGDRTQLAVGLTRAVSGRLGADLLLVSANVGWVRAYGIDHAEGVGLQADDWSGDSWGAQLVLAATYNSLIGGINLTPRVAYARDIEGATPAPTATFLEGRSTLVWGLTVEYLQNYEIDVSYIAFSGGGSANQIRDRDQLQLRASVYF
ncbi:MAG: DUF1302 domain-containing protein [Gammaproteobacteria bacterium]|nr:DUF1302 domain-containing protein [Gammaproteobacteria bacterium]